jgi:adenylate cyclase
VSYYFDGDYEQTVTIAKRVVSDRPDHPVIYRWLAAALGQLGRVDEARMALEKAIAIAPDTFNLYIRTRMPWMRQIDFEHMVDGIQKAGWRD